MKAIILLSLLFSFNSLFAQDYWQQEVNYTINVQLNDETHFLHGFETFEYVNNSPETLDKIYIHLWPNAYKNDESALADQLYSNGNGILKFAEDKNKGYIDSLDFKVGGTQLHWEFEEFNQDICIVTLNSPLKPGEKIEISTPFRVKLPSGSISRLGHIGQSYQITQWYPKPAVYDNEGWHHMPYLNQGEFFSEYGSFDVSITLPKNYVVGATGDLQTKSEINFMNEKAAATLEAIDKGSYFLKNNALDNPNDFPASSKALKTIRFTQKNVHDFAWFADKRYQVLKGEVELPYSKRKVTSWALYTPKNGRLWKNAIEYINDGTFYYSKWNGDYPYNNVTAVDGTISAGGGMEYPNVTVIGNTGSAIDLEIVIVHEVGHNWFYGQLGTNERVHGWMDEGMNTLNEVRYVQTKYPDNTLLSNTVLNGRFHFNDLDHHDQSDYAYRLLAYLGEDQPIEMHSAKFTQANYGVVMYMKTGLVFFYLKDYLGEELFDEAMQNYYREWEFKHPRPIDMKNSLEESTGKNLDWLFTDLIQTTNHIDYKISNVKVKDGKAYVTVKNVGQVDGPIEVAAINNGVVTETKWIEPGNKKNTIVFDGAPDAIRIDPSNDIPEVNRHNNYWKNKGLFGKIEPIKFEFFTGDNEAEKNTVFWLPMINGNFYDRAMLGVVIHNLSVVPNKFSYVLAPFYSTGRQFVSGFSELSYNCLPKRNFKQSRFGLSFKTYKNDTTFLRNDSYFVGITPYWQAKIGHRGVKKRYNQTIKVQGLYRYDQIGSYNTDIVGAFADYSYEYHATDHTAGFKLRNDYINNLTTGENFDRVLIEGNYSWKYLRQMNRKISLRVFGGYYLSKDFGNQTNQFNPYTMSLSGSAGYQDLFLESYYLGRNLTSGFNSNQRSENMGGFKSTSWYGTTSNWMTSANIELEIPFLPKIFKLYTDYGLFHNGTAINSASDAGIAIKLGNIVNFYFPMYMSKEMRDSYGSTKLFNKYGEKIRFTLNFNLFSKPFKINQFIN